MDEFRSQLADNILTTQEVAQLLGLSKQRIIDLVKTGRIQPLKQTSQGYLFLRDDVQNQVTPPMIVHYPKFFYRGGTTRHCLSYFREHISELGKITQAFVYFNFIDAIRDNFYIPDQYYHGRLQIVAAPYLVLRDEEGEEMWLNGCNCGYGGEGPRGTAKIFKELGFSDGDIEPVFSNRVVQITRDEFNRVNILSNRSIADYFDESMRRNPSISFPHLSIYLSDANLVLIFRPNRRVIREFPLKTVLEHYRTFLPEPYEFFFLTDEQARNLGYLLPERIDFHYTREVLYHTIIRDVSGREIWLQDDLGDKSISAQETLADLFQLYDFNLKESGPLQGIASWLEKKIRKGNPEQPYQRIMRHK